MANVPDLPKVEAAIIAQTNDFRASQSERPVKAEGLLAKAARDYARFLAASTVFSHEADGRRPIDRIKAAGYQPCTTAENLAQLAHSRGFTTAELASMMVEGWKNSPGHRKNMLLPLVTETGVAVVKARGEEKYVGVQLFGRPIEMQYKFEVENRSGKTVAYALGGSANSIENGMRVRHTVCEPLAVAFETAKGGFLSKPVVARYETREGQVFKLTAAKGGSVAVEVEMKR